ncbi:hypothetical protein JCM30471_13390 [Desulfuromonas carbonis]|uniref:hypothetical protein n=1 Tax=Desulfuromonas sp. DDH964 TaxID=1823759 RepID=UPI00078D2945|nr:hypothetical protein [Desulfuromonas sp. DDH964]AMV72824.1 hypothetical protein DBW_2494 [Desulfuromonas sp. DDH964]
MLNGFRGYLATSGTVKEKSVPYYGPGVGNAYSHCRVGLAQPLATDQKSVFLTEMAKSHEEWQVKQGRLPLRCFICFLTTLRGHEAKKNILGVQSPLDGLS